MAPPKRTLSIVIPAYNEESVLRAALDSIAAQSIPVDEVIVVDNHSQDATDAIALSYPFVKLLQEPKRGIAPARDKGFNAARSDLIGRIDADTVLPPDWVATVLQLCDKHADEIYALSGPAYAYGLPRWLGQLVGHVVIVFGFFGISRLFLRHQPLYGSNMVITAAAWQKVKSETCTDSQSVHEDVDLSIHVSRYGQVVYEPRLKVGVSRRAFLGESPAKFWWRLQAWRQAASRHRNLSKTVL